MRAMDSSLAVSVSPHRSINKFLHCFTTSVMTAWGESQGVPEDSIIKLYGDPLGTVTEVLEMQLEHAGPKKKGLINRCKRFALYIENGVVKIVRVAESEDDPAGDEKPDATLAESMMEAIAELRSETKDEL